MPVILFVPQEDSYTSITNVANISLLKMDLNQAQEMYFVTPKN
jgi:hypothetical protein